MPLPRQHNRTDALRAGACVVVRAAARVGWARKRYTTVWMYGSASKMRTFERETRESQASERERERSSRYARVQRKNCRQKRLPRAHRKYVARDQRNGQSAGQSRNGAQGSVSKRRRTQKGTERSERKSQKERDEWPYRENAFEEITLLRENVVMLHTGMLLCVYVYV